MIDFEKAKERVTQAEVDEDEILKSTDEIDVFFEITIASSC